MAIIKCVECGKDISSFAPACPNCGCPAEYQAKTHTDDKKVDEVRNDSGLSRLKYPEQWADILESIRSHRGDSLEKAKKLTGKRNVGLVVARMIENDEIPVDLIIERFPEQAASTPVAHSVPVTAPCSACGKTISTKAETCPHCGQVTGVHVCPRCGSVNTAPLTGFDKVAYTALFGIFAAKTVVSKYWCKDCRFEF